MNECSLCSHLPGRFCVTNENLSEFPGAKKLVTIFHSDESGALPEYKVMKCTECTTAYIFSSHATISGGDYESVDAYCRLAPDESAKINAFFAWLESAGERKEKLFSGIKRFLADFLENDQAFDLSALLDLKKNSCR